MEAGDWLAGMELGRNSTMDREQEKREYSVTEEWAEPIEVGPRRATTSVVSVRLPTSELNAIRRAARDAGVTTSEFIRRAALTAAEGTAFSYSISVQTGFSQEPCAFNSGGMSIRHITFTCGATDTARLEAASD
jgi:hypothetical protein